VTGKAVFFYVRTNINRVFVKFTPLFSGLLKAITIPNRTGNRQVVLETNCAAKTQRFTSATNNH